MDSGKLLQDAKCKKNGRNQNVNGSDNGKCNGYDSSVFCCWRACGYFSINIKKSLLQIDCHNMLYAMGKLPLSSRFLDYPLAFLNQ